MYTAEKRKAPVTKDVQEDLQPIPQSSSFSLTTVKLPLLPGPSRPRRALSQGPHGRSFGSFSGRPEGGTALPLPGAGPELSLNKGKKQILEKQQLFLQCQLVPQARKIKKKSLEQLVSFFLPLIPFAKLPCAPGDHTGMTWKQKTWGRQAEDLPPLDPAPGGCRHP